MVRKIISLSSLLIFSYVVLAQSTYIEFHTQSQSTNNTGMYILGSWALANLATGAIGWNRYNGDTKYFHQMNFMWNTVNLTIAGLALYSNFATDGSLLSSAEIMEKHLRTEKILLINTVLDLGYMGSGLLLRHLSSKSEKRMELMNGYGRSLMLQGGFLLGFDLILYTVLRNQRFTFSDQLSLTVTTNFSGLQLCFQF